MQPVLEPGSIDIPLTFEWFDTTQFHTSLFTFQSNCGEGLHFSAFHFSSSAYYNYIKNEQKVGMLLPKRTDTRGVGISSMRKSIPPYNHTQ